MRNEDGRDRNSVEGVRKIASKHQTNRHSRSCIYGTHRTV